MAHSNTPRGRWLLGAVLLICNAALSAQTPLDLGYYLPLATTQYDAAVPTPRAWLGYEVGERHATHDQLVGYLRELARVSPRLRVSEYGRTHEGRPLLCLTISAPANLARLEEIRTARRLLADPTRSAGLNPANYPAVTYQGYSIHGNEASGSNAALAVAYHLAAAQGPAIDSLLAHTVILLDPCFNPDGMQRFATWVNSHRSATERTDPTDDEFNEHWPGGRTNHYWFDLNRDWLVQQQPESPGRVRIFQDWLPNVLTDHHEMGSQATFFFQPGVPSRVNPITPARNQQLTAAIALRHAQALSDRGILFFTRESYDDFYYGKGSTYPDANGCVGILFEQASSRGSAQETDNGVLTFPYSIRNQVITSLSTLRAVGEMRVELNDYLREFYTSALDEARRAATQGFFFGDAQQSLDLSWKLVDLLESHHIEVHRTDVELPDGDLRHPAFYVPCEQPQYRLVRGIFERQLEFQDSIFYDISAWTLPDAFGLPWRKVARRDAGKLPKNWAGTAIGGVRTAVGHPAFAFDSTLYAWVVRPDGYDLPRLLGELLRRNVRVKVATKPFELEGARYPEGTLLIPTDRQSADPDLVWGLLDRHGCQFAPVLNGLTTDGPDLGSASFVLCRQPKVLIISGEGASPTDAGEIWHLLDQRLGLSPTVVESVRFGNISLTRYNVIVLPDGTYPLVSAEKLKQFVDAGGTLIATGAALNWLKNNDVAAFSFRSATADWSARGARRPYASRSDDNAARTLPGSIFEAELDLTHPLCYGYTRPRLPVFLPSGVYLEPGSSAYNTPVVFTKEPLLAGYLHPSQRQAVSGAAGVVVSPQGRGRVIGFPTDPCFRAFWLGTERLMANAVFFGGMVR